MNHEVILILSMNELYINYTSEAFSRWWDKYFPKNLNGDQE